MKSVPLDIKKHDRKQFDCGIAALNNFLLQMANQQSKKDNARTFVLEDETLPEHIIGFYTLTTTTLDLSQLPEPLKKKHLSSESGGLIARLAVDKRFKNRGFGEWLLIDALKKLLAASDAVAFPVVVVDDKHGVQDFYKKFGFQCFEGTENKLFLTISDIRASFS